MTEHKNNTDSLKEISAEQWEKLTQQRIYFGHQSVGYNIIDGIQELAKKNKNINLNIIELDHQEGISNGGFLAHGKIGKNRSPESKLNQFYEFIEKNHAHLDIAFMKFCYVDITPDSDLDEVFMQYRKTINKIKKKFPNIKIIHFTVPLETSRIPLKFWFKIFKDAGLSYKWHMIKTLNKIWRTEANITRNTYNDKLREDLNNDLIFDIAQIESTHINGKREQFKTNDKIYYSLVPEYTDDGGHLNAVGQQVIASNLLNFLTKIN